MSSENDTKAITQKELKDVKEDSVVGPIAQTTTVDSMNEKQGDIRYRNRVGDEIDITTIQPGTDKVYEAKIVLLNQAILDLGMGKYQWLTALLTGFGWYIDNFWLQAITIISPFVKAEFVVKRIAFLTVGKYVGLVLGSSLWPITADYIGRKPAFNITLGLSSVAGLIAAGSPNFTAITTLCAIVGLATGGNQPVDSAIFLELIPASHQYLLTMQSAFWSVGQAVAVLIAWPLVANYSCPTSTPAGECGYHQNLGWRYALWTYGGINFAMFVGRFVFPLHESPKYLLGRGRDAKVVEVIHKIAAYNGATSWLTIDHFEQIDREVASESSSAHQLTAKSVIRSNLAKFEPQKLKGLFSTPKMAFSTICMILLWCMIGMAYPLYNSFIPLYLADKGVTSGNNTINSTYRTYCIQAVCGIPGSIIAGLAVDVRRIGRKGVGVLSCILTGVFLFLYTRANSSSAILGFSCAISFFQNIVYGILYSYTPELFPAPIRGSGNGLVAVFNRFSGLAAPFIAAYVGVNNSPIWVSAGLFIVAGVVFAILPYEMRGRAAA
ncbi:uncharacterized protein Z518_03541 [Rhinocladiella mackenziei CBS 650.93]|uniref:Rhinocladiella mackenziei CBS 650.93 unplaced genomic scaffold supercont1.2, whole genome shotgun sequence n=1 Tax=Rhinocladiella mackenziei CBS 650.93 TaxID=1442369 RepID=A0A0D2ISA9_9EURO|nr:uncharacterized protein Z518_03541 [Rhinocladiella mackenziei CBS 650.93]KIX08884.1 hypothetical protein Z518_03541 [Rhinocladiella mackenziei CBS 650.93]